MKQDETLLRDAFEVLEAHADPNFNVELVKQRIKARLGDDLSGTGADDPYFPQVLQYVLATGHYQMNRLLREFWIGYSRIAKIQQALEDAGILTPAGDRGERQVLRPAPLRVVNE